MPKRAAREWVVAQLLGLSAEQVDGIRPLFPKERGGKRVDDRKVLQRHHPCHAEGAAAGWMPQPPMAPTQPSTTVAAAGETRVFLI